MGNNPATECSKAETLAHFLLGVCQNSVSRTPKGGLWLDISLNISTVNIESISSHVRRFLATMLMNVIEYSFYERSSGEISIHLADLPKQRLRISAFDNGWGPDAVDGRCACRLENFDTLGDLTVTPAYSDGTGMMTTLTVDRKRLQGKSATARPTKSILLSHCSRALQLCPENLPCNTVPKIESYAGNVL